MKEKNSIRKIMEGRCRGIGTDYVGMKKANESHSRGAAAEIYDPIAKRTVDVLSMGERWQFWLLRYDESVVEIREQHVMHPGLVAKAALQLGISVPKDLLSTDLLALYDDGGITAYSVKRSRSELDPSTPHGKSVIRRQALEKSHWEMLGVDFKIVFADEMDRHRAGNIAAAMVYYDPIWVSTPDQMYKFLIAHHVVEPDMSRPIPFAKIARENEEKIRKLYEREAAAYLRKEAGGV